MPEPVSIVVVTWNSRPWIGSCLSSVEASGCELIVIDNASTDGTSDFVRERHQSARLVVNRTNRGFAAAINQGFELSRGDTILLLNPDVTASPGAVSILGRSLDQHPECGAMAGLLLTPTGEVQRGFNVRRFPTLTSWAVDLLLIDKIWPSNPVTRRYLALDLDYSKSVEVDQPAGACLMIRRTAFERVGGMDERFFPAWFEDVDLCLRLRQAGWRIRLEPAAIFTHVGGTSLAALGSTAFARVWYRNLERLAHKHDSTAGFLALKLLILVGMLERIMISMARLRRDEVRTYGRVFADVASRWHPQGPQ